MQQGGRCKQIQISQILNDRTAIDIIEPGIFIYCHIPLQGVSLPAKIRIFHKLDHDHRDSQNVRDLPEDLNIYFSMNEPEPGPKKYDKKVDSAAIQAMNQKKENFVFFGSEKTREKQKFQDTIYIAFVCFHNPCNIEITCQFEKSMKEKQEEIKQLITKAKFEDNDNTHMSKKINKQYQIFTMLF